MTNTEELDDRLHIVEHDERFASLERTIDDRFNHAATQMERIIEMLGKIVPRE